MGIEKGLLSLLGLRPRAAVAAHATPARSSTLLDRRTLLISLLAMILAVASAFIAKFLVGLIGLITNIAFYQRFSTAFSSPAGNQMGWGVILVPIYGGIIVGIMARYGSRAIRGHGIPEAMEQVLMNQSRIPARLVFLKPLSAAIAIGTGGPFGAEGPIIATGAALGSVIGQFFKTSAHERKTLLGAGAAAGMTAIFNSPVSAVILAIELLVFEFRPRSFIPICLAVVVATAVRTVLMGSHAVFAMPDVAQPIPLSILGYAIEGIVVGFASVLITRATYGVEDWFETLPIHWMWWPALGAVAVGVIGYFYPHTLGVGYDNVEAILSQSMTTKVILMLCLMKFISWVISLGSGTSGGTLAPLFTIGGGIGLACGLGIQAIVPQVGIDLRMAALVGMAALFAGASRALLASIIFAFETTRQPLALLPLLSGCSLAFLVSCFRMQHTIMTEKIAKRGVHVPDEYGADYLEQISVKAAMTASLVTLSVSDTIDKILAKVDSEDPAYQHQGFPVVDAKGELVGVITLKDLYHAKGRGTAPVGQLLKRQPIFVSVTSSLREAANLMVKEGIGRVIVVDPAAHRAPLGILTRSDVLNAEKRRLEEAHEREVTLQVFRRFPRSKMKIS